MRSPREQPHRVPEARHRTMLPFMNGSGEQPHQPRIALASSTMPWPGSGFAPHCFSILRAAALDTPPAKTTSGSRAANLLVLRVRRSERLTVFQHPQS